SHVPVGGGTHGGLSQYELHNVCVAYGPAFQQRQVRTLPSGTIDLLPTLLHVLDYRCPPSVEGRVLYEALAQTPAAQERARGTRKSSAEPLTSAGLYRQHLTTTRVSTTVYLERGWVA